MRPIRAFLFARDKQDQWGCQVFRDFEPLLEAALAANGGKQQAVGIHVGFERPSTETVAELLSQQDGLVFLSQGALGTMPCPVRATASCIGAAGETAFYAALDGFGYQVEEAAETTASAPPVSQRLEAEALQFTGWVSLLSTLNPALAEKLRTAGIVDEDSYLLREADLDLETRYAAGLRRYELLGGEQCGPVALLEHLEALPPWLLSAPIVTLDLSVRSTNVCAAHEIETVADFARYGLNGLYKLPNLGRKSVHELNRQVGVLFNTGEPLKVSRAVLNRHEVHGRERLGASVTDTRDLGGDAGHYRHFGQVSPQSITEGFSAVTQNFTENERRVWAGRLGLFREQQTLQQVADELGLTRERIRQLEVKLYKKVQWHPFWNELSRRVRAHLDGRRAPLFLSGLSAIDPWFDGAAELVEPLRELTERLPQLGFHVLPWNDTPVLSYLTSAQWLEALNQAKAVLAAIADQHPGEKEAMSQAAGVLLGKGEEMREPLLEEVSKFCVWSVQPNGARVLQIFGKSVSALVSGMLQASATPLHVDELLQRVRTLLPKEVVNLALIRRAVGEVGTLYGRGLYGLRKHCPLSPSELLTVRAEVEDFVSGGSSTKQWHSSELYDELLSRGFSYDGKLTKYIVNLALADSAILVYLRRMIWGIRSEWQERADARLDVKQAILALLEQEGKPLTTSQLRSRLIEERGVNTNFQIWASSPLVRLEPGLWGLEGRDVDMERARVLAYRLLKELSVRQEGLHVSEAAAFLGLTSENEVAMLVSIATKDGLRVDRGQHCYLQPWGESRRISPWEATAATLKAHPQGLSRSELQLYVERSVRRKVDRQQVSTILQNIDALYDPKSGLWKFSGTSDDDNDEAADAVDLSLEA